MKFSPRFPTVFSGLLLFVFFLSPNKMFQGPEDIVELSSIELPSYSVALNNQYLYVGSDSEIAIYDIQNLTSPQKVGSLFVLDIQPTNLIFHNNMLFVAAQDKGLVIVDVSNPRNPTKLSTLPGNVGDVLVHDELLIVADRSALKIFNLEFIPQLNEIGRYIPQSGMPITLSIKDNLLLIGNSQPAVQVGGSTRSNLELLDISNPSEIKRLSSVNLSRTVFDIETANDKIFLGEYAFGMVEGTISNNSSLSIRESPNPYGVTDLAIHENILYFLDCYNFIDSSGFPNCRLLARDISNNQFLGYIDLPEMNMPSPMDIIISNNIIFVAHNTNGTFILCHQKGDLNDSCQLSFEESGELADPLFAWIGKKEGAINTLEKATHEFIVPFSEPKVIEIEGFDETAARHLIDNIGIYPDYSITPTQQAAFIRAAIQEEAVATIFSDYVFLAGISADTAYQSYLTIDSINILVRAFLGDKSTVIPLLIKTEQDIAQFTVHQIQDQNEKQIVQQKLLDYEFLAELIPWDGLSLDSVSDILLPMTLRANEEDLRRILMQAYVKEFVARVEPSLVKGIRSVDLTADDVWVIEGDIDQALFRASDIQALSRFTLEGEIAYTQRVERLKAINDVITDLSDIVTAIGYKPSVVTGVLGRISTLQIDKYHQNEIYFDMRCLREAANVVGWYIFQPQPGSVNCADLTNRVDVFKINFETPRLVSLYAPPVILDQSYESTIESGKQLLDSSEDLVDVLTDIQSGIIDARTLLEEGETGQLGEAHDNLTGLVDDYIDKSADYLEMITPKEDEAYTQNTYAVAVDTISLDLNLISTFFAFEQLRITPEDVEIQEFLADFLLQTDENITSVISNVDEVSLSGDAQISSDFPITYLLIGGGILCIVFVVVLFISLMVVIQVSKKKTAQK
jgi:hypothetical protein